MLLKNKEEGHGYPVYPILGCLFRFHSTEPTGFITHEYIPALERLKIKLVGGYYVAVGK